MLLKILLVTSFFINVLYFKVFSQDFFVDSLKIELKKVKNDSIKCLILQSLAENGSEEEWPKFNEQYLKLSTKKSKEEKKESLKKYFKKHLAISYNNKGYLLSYLGKNESAIEYHQKAISICEETNDLEGLAESMNHIGLIFKQQGDLMKALELYYKSLKIEEKFNKEEDMSYTLNNIGSIHFNLGDEKKALDYFHKCKNIQEKLNDTLGIARTFLNIGAIYFKEKENDKALNMYTKSLDLMQKVNDIRGVAYALNYIGNVQLNLSKYSEALKNYEKSLVLKKQTNDIKGECGVLKNIGQAYLKLNKLNLAKNYGEKAFELSKEIKNAELIKESSFLLYEIYKKQKNQSQALMMHELYTKFKDSINNEESRKIAYQSNIRYEFDKKALQDSLLYKEKVETQKLKTKTVEKQYQSQRRILYLSITILIISVLFVVFYLKKYREKTKLSKQLEESLIERDLLNKEIHHRVKNNLQIISSLINMQKMDQSNQNVVDVLQQSQNRIQAMALIHEKLYQSGNLKDVKLDEYLSNLLEYFADNYDFELKNISYNLVLPKINLSSEQIIPLGLISNEIILNSIKYGFHKTKSIFEINGKFEENVLTLVFKDNGNGFPENWSEKSKKSLGMNLIQGLTRQLKGKVLFYNENGAVIKIDINLL
jgi:two-component system, sensor histidine kinase PdtaS